MVSHRRPPTQSPSLNAQHPLKPVRKKPIVNSVRNKQWSWEKKRQIQTLTTNQEKFQVLESLKYVLGAHKSLQKILEIPS